MRIHSSSLTLTPAGINRQPAGKQNGGQNKVEKSEALSGSETLNHNQSVPLTYSIQDLTQNTTRDPLPDLITEPSFTDYPINTRTTRALNAYSLELNKLSSDHSTRTIQRIDTYA